ncbi:hypothetical protein Tco_1261471 [Tanacetum coccineum]
MHVTAWRDSGRQYLVAFPTYSFESTIGEELEYPFFEGDGSSIDEWRDYGMAGDDYEGPPIFDDDQYEEESMPVYDTDIEDVIEEEEGFIEKRGFGGKEDNIEDVVVVANDLFGIKSRCSWFKMFPRRIEGEELEYPFLRVMSSSSDDMERFMGWVVLTIMKGSQICDDDQCGEESMPVYDTDIERCH